MGIDLGTTRTVVVYADRGNYPVVIFCDTSGDVHEFFPSVIAFNDGELVTGFEAMDLAQSGAPVLRSLKRHFADENLTTQDEIEFAGRKYPLLELFTTFLKGLVEALHTDSSIADQLETDPIENVVAAVPAHAGSTQRFLTLEAFKTAGLPVSVLLNEPSAAGFEYTHRKPKTITSRRNRVVVYDLGGGTFDASRIDVEDLSHNVMDTVGINNIGGDDFDEVLADLALQAAGNPELDEHQRSELIADTQIAKEGLAPQSRRIAIDVAGETVIIAVQDFYDAVTGLVGRTLEAMAPLLENLDDLAGIYLVGGASSLPIVPRLLRNKFGRRVQRSPYPSASTAIGLAIAADPDSGFALRDRVSRGFGVFREGKEGTEVTFDPIFSRDEVLGANGLEKRRTYRPIHNIGKFRFVEYSKLRDWQPIGDIMPFATVTFPYDASLQGKDSSETDIERIGEMDTIEELYRIDSNGIISLQITDLSTGYSQHHHM